MRTTSTICRLSFIALVLGSLLGCSASYDMAAEYDLDTANKEGDDDDAIDTDKSDTGLVEPSFFSLDGTLVLNMGMVDLKASDLQIAYWIERPAKTVEECSTHLPMVSADAGIVLPKDIELDGWWTLVPDAGSSCTYSWPADQINLGLGEEDKRLEQAATAAGFDQSNLFGLYVQTGGINGTIFVYGVAGTEDQFAGTESPSDDGSLLTGEFRLEALHLLPL